MRKIGFPAESVAVGVDLLAGFLTLDDIPQSKEYVLPSCSSMTPDSAPEHAT